MATTKVAITIDSELLVELDALVDQRCFLIAAELFKTPGESIRASFPPTNWNRS